VDIGNKMMFQGGCQSLLGQSFLCSTLSAMRIDVRCFVTSQSEYF